MKKLRRIVGFSFPLILLAVIVFGSAMVSAADTKAVLQYYDQWEETLHSNHALANDMNQGAINDPGGHDAECMKCHTEAGYIQWSEHGFKPPGHGEHSFADKPVESGTALSVTCIACHDPESTKEPMVRLSGKTPELMSGYAIDADLGTGATCVICHNSNRGRRNDVAMPKATQHAPHETSQADVMMGENFYFIKNGNVSPSVGEVDNTCVGCHMANGNHNMAGSKKPHGVRAKVLYEYSNLKKDIEESIAKFIMAGINAGDFKLLHMQEDETEDKDFTTFKKGKEIDVNIRYFHGRQACDITIDGTRKFAFINVLISGGKKFLETAQGQVIAKAGWNYYMVSHDGSFGAHNPDVVIDALVTSQKRLAELNFSKL